MFTRQFGNIFALKCGKFVKNGFKTNTSDVHEVDTIGF